jgi:adenylylsulfate kinase
MGAARLERATEATHRNRAGRSSRRLNRNPLGVIVACPPFGTAQLARLLDVHPQIAVAPRMAWLATMPNDPQAVGPDGMVLAGMARRLAQKLDVDAELPSSGSRDQLDAMLADGGAMHYVEFVAWLFDRHALDRDKPFAVADADGLAPDLVRLAALCPQARVVHVIRDGREVAACAAPSAAGAPTRQTFGDDPVARSALCWERHVRSAREAGALLGPERYREVRHEQLDRSPEAACRSLCGFLGVPYDEAMAGVPTDGGAGRVDGSAAPGSAQTALALEELARWEAVAGDLLDELGYARRAPPAAAAQRASAAELRRALEARPGPAPAPRAAPRTGDGSTVWLTGLSGAGKSTVARLVERRLRERGAQVEVLDGDAVRRNLCQDLGFSREDRDTNIRRIAYVADLLSRNGVTVIVAAISPYRAVRDEARALMGGRFVEVHVRAPLRVCVERDVKGLYAKALAGDIAQFTGISDPYEPPTRPELVLDTEHETPERSAARLLAVLDGRTLR